MIDDLIARLRRTAPHIKRTNGKIATHHFPVNPDGPEAADVLAKLQAERAVQIDAAHAVGYRDCAVQLHASRDADRLAVAVAVRNKAASVVAALSSGPDPRSAWNLPVDKATATIMRLDLEAIIKEVGNAG